MDLALADAHRVQQVRATAPVLSVLDRASRILNPSDLDGSFATYLRVATPLVKAGRAQSGVLSLAYYREARRRAGIDPGADFPVVAPDDIVVEQLARSLYTTGPGTVRAATARGVPYDVAVRAAQTALLRSAKRHVLNGGREALTSAASSDRHARGWSRVSDGSPCAFCAMLVSRGPVYTEATVRFRSHDGCGCGVAVVFDGQDGWTPQARAIRDVYDAAIHDDDGTFRAVWERRLREGAADAAPSLAA